MCGRGLSGQVLATAMLGDYYVYTLVFDFDAVVGTVFNLVNHPLLAFGPTAEPTDSGDALSGSLSLGTMRADPNTVDLTSGGRGYGWWVPRAGWVKPAS